MKKMIPFICAACLLVSCGNNPVSITLPKDYEPLTTNTEYSELQQAVKKTSNTDGSVTYELDSKKQKDLLEKVKQDFEKARKEWIGSKEMPNVTDIIANKDFSHITVKTKSEKLELTEQVLHLALYSFCELYSLISGNEKLDYAIEIVNEKSGDVLKKVTADDIRQMKEKLDGFQDKMSGLGDKINEFADQFTGFVDKITK